MRYKIQFFLLLLFAVFSASSCIANNTLPCVYTPKESKANPYPELTQFSNCGVVDGKGNVQLSGLHFSQIWFDKDGLASIRIKDGIYYVNKNGKVVRTHLFDNGADYFKEGLARTIQNNKYGFINKSLDIVIESEYDFAFPFSNNFSKVCNGCKINKVDEHKELSGGAWGYIDKTGKVIVPVKYRKENLPNPKAK